MDHPLAPLVKEQQGATGSKKINHRIEPDVSCLAVNDEFTVALVLLVGAARSSLSLYQLSIEVKGMS
jgi:hypothetical protein